MNYVWNDVGIAAAQAEQGSAELHKEQGRMRQDITWECRSRCRGDRRRPIGMHSRLVLAELAMEPDAELVALPIGRS